MNNVDANIIFEHPLNEKTRMWLRIEFLLTQLKNSKTFPDDTIISFFYTLCEILEIIERNDIRSDLCKELEVQKQKLSVWMNVNGVDTQILGTMIQQLSEFILQLNASSQLAINLKEDRLLSAVRQRLTIPGGCCSFDLPAFYLWRQLPQDARTEQLTAWLDHFAVLDNAISFYLTLIRQSASFKQYVYSQNFHHIGDNEINMIRIRLPKDKHVYPQVSGHRSRYAIRFMPLATAISSVREEHDKKEVEPFEFEIARCEC